MQQPRQQRVAIRTQLHNISDEHQQLNQQNETRQDISNGNAAAAVRLCCLGLRVARLRHCGGRKGVRRAAG